MKPHHHSTSRPFQSSAFRLSGLLPRRLQAFRLSAFLPRLFQPSAFRLSGFCLILAAFSPSAFPQQPLFPTPVGTYYYDGYDPDTSLHIYISTTGTYYYVDSAGVTTIGGRASLPVTTPYRAIITTGGTANFQFNNKHADLYLVTTGTASDDWLPNPGSTGTSYAVRSGTWRVNDATFNLVSTGGAAIDIQGFTMTATGAVLHPATLIGTNINAIVEQPTASGRYAVNVRTGATVIINGGTISKTVTGSDTGASETISMNGNEDNLGSSAHFHGENLTIIANGPNIRALNMANGNNTFTLIDSTITAITNKTNTSESIYLADTQNLGGNHFTGTNLAITNNSGRTFAFDAGDNTITLVNSTLHTDGKGAAFGWNATTTSTRRAFALGSFVTLENTTVTTTADYAPIFQMIGDWGGATVTGGTLSTTGAGSTILRLVANNDTNDHAKFTALFHNTTLDARQGSIIDINIAAGDSANYGQAGGIPITFAQGIDESYEILIQSSTVTGAIAALRIANAGAHTAPYGHRTHVGIYDSLFSGGIQMVAGGGVNETSGATLVFTASNSQLTGGLHITAADTARRPHQADFRIFDSTFTGDITLANRGILSLHLSNTPLDGNLSLDGSTSAGINLINSPVTGAITIAGNATLAGSILGSGAVGSINAHGGATDLTLDRAPASITATGNATLRLLIGSVIDNPLLIGNDVAIPAGLHLSGNATLDLTLRDAARFTGDIAIHDRATLALATRAPGALTLDGNLALAGTLRLPNKTTITGTLAFTAPAGTIAIENARPGSLTLVNGLVNTGLLDILSIDGSALGDGEIHIIHDLTNNFTTAGGATPNATTPLTLARPVDYGLAAYTLQNRPDGAHLVGGLERGSFGAGGAAVFNSQSLIVEDWFAALSPLNYRLDQLRQPDGASLSRGSLWLQSRADTTRVNRAGASLDFTSRTYGLTAGIDTCRDLRAATITSGLFADTSRTIRDFINNAGGTAIAVGGGLYAHYRHNAGLHLSAIARFDTYETTLNTNNHTNAMRAAYHTQAAGLALEAGYRFTLAADWWLEPAAQISLVTLPGVSYTTESNREGNIIPISTTDARATQYQARLSFGKELHKNWRLRGHLAHSRINASGGAFVIPDLPSTPNFTIAGNRTEFSLGIIRLIGRTGRLTLDAAYTAASDYKRPLTLNAGWGMAW